MMSAVPRATVLTLCLSVSLVLAACSDGDGPTSRTPTTSPPDDATASTAPAEAAARASSSPPASEPAVVVVPELVTDEVGVPRELIEVASQTLVVDQVGLVHVLGEDGRLRSEPFLDLREQILTPSEQDPELGLLGLALAPDADETGAFYTVATQSADSVPGLEVPEGTEQVTVLTRWQADLDVLSVDPGSAEVVLAAPTQGSVHTGGEIVFDDGGLLYTAFGAPTGDPIAQDPESLAGSVIRIDPGRQGEAYTVPDDNPFADGGEGRPEIFSYGYRNPWRLSWDPTHGLLVGEAMATEKHQQVGQPAAGDNAGYPEVPGACWEDGTLTELCSRTSAGDPIGPPVLEYDHRVGTILSGVVVVPSEASGPLAGRVVVSDWSGDVLVATPGEPPWSWVVAETSERLITPASYLWDLDADSGGAVYALVADRDMGEGDGAVYRLSNEDEE